MDTIALTHNIDLLRVVFDLAVDKLRGTRSPLSGVSAQLQSKLVTLGLILDSIPFSDPTLTVPLATHDAISRTLDDFELLVLDTISADPPKTLGVAQPKLRSLNECLLGGGAATQYLHLESLRYDDDILENLDRLIHELRHCKRNIAEPVPVGPREAGSKPSENLWHALCKHLSDMMTCPTPNDTHQMRLFLGTLVDHANALRLLVTGADPQQWHPVDFYPEASGNHDSPRDSNEPSPSCWLCTRLHKRSKIRALKFCYDSNSICESKKGNNIKDWRPRLQTLQDWLKHDTDRGHRKALQCILAQWLGHAYGTPWLPQTWDTESIWLDEDNTANDHPMLYTEHQSIMTNNTPTGVPDSATMIRFALLMLRIEFPTVDLTIDDEDQLDEEELDELLDEFLERASIKKEMEARFKKIMTVCHEWNPSTAPDAQFVLDKIFRPLREELVWRFERDMPKVPERPPMCSPPATRTVHSRPPRALAGSSVIPRNGIAPHPLAHLYDDHESAADSMHVKSANAFLSRFAEFRTNHAVDATQINRRVKIAILDTGFDKTGVRGLLDEAKRRRSHMPVDDSERNVIASTRVFVGGGRSMKDECGHGTRVLGLLLMTAPDASFYLAKVSTSMRDECGDSIEHIIEALDWAIQHEVDLINMSFGFDFAPDDSRLQDKILEAHRKGIKMFAAAANHGRNGPRAFPASAREVICINASSGQGAWAADINPSKTGHHDKWSTLGVGISFGGMAGGPRSGTSYASPIAVGTIANVIDNVRYLHGQGHLTETTAARLQSLDGIEKIMGSMGQDGYLAPWLLWNDPSLRPAQMAAILQRISR